MFAMRGVNYAREINVTHVVADTIAVTNEDA